LSLDHKVLENSVTATMHEHTVKNVLLTDVGALKMREWKNQHGVAGVENAGVEISARCCRGGKCRSGKFRISLSLPETAFIKYE